MPEETAFLALYEELGLDAGCSLEDFKRAYRRRAAQLHPDRGGVGVDVRRLQRLNVLYGDALVFHQAHGRLPGSPTRAGTVNTGTVFAEPSLAPDLDTLPLAPGRNRRWWPAALFLLALLLYWFGLGIKQDGPPSLDPAGPGDHVAPGLFQPQAPSLALGMDKTLARTVLGQPDSETTARWDYGSSWVEFQCGKVTAWYSSPLRPLRVDMDSARAPSAQAPGC